ncbi:hypothetical protein [Streptomyces subrutilus]|uniref:hypothetical protein n=1 Tax=Streptomyces subrutilus TaxID=36818 RepID=UPI00114CAA89|nr:hypothetical protein [Streptomyces subrutilus]
MSAMSPRQRLGIAVALSVLVPTASACTPTPKALLAIERTETGATRALIAPCPDYDALNFTVFREDGESVELERWAVSNETWRGSPPSIELLVTPQGWKSQEATLANLEGDGKYTVTIDGAVRGRGLDGEVSFTPNQLGTLTAGEVLIKDGSGTRAVSRSEFLKKDSDRCTP